MRRYLTIMEGATPATARPVIASEDPALIRAVVRELTRRLADPADEHDGAGADLRLVPDGGAGR